MTSTVTVLPEQASRRALPDQRDFLTTQSPRRLTGIDVARGIAVLGMYAVHVGPDPNNGGLGILFLPFEGHSSALFAVLAGLSIALMSGGQRPKRGIAQLNVSLRLCTRAVLLVVIGLWLTWLDTGYLVILAYYGVCFVLVLPFLRMKARGLAIVALCAAVVLPIGSYILRSYIAPRDLVTFLPDVVFTGFSSLSDIGELLRIWLLTGTFPAITLMIFILAGLAIGRMDLASRVVCRRLFIGGATLTVSAYFVSWLATDVFGGMKAIYATLAAPADLVGMSPVEFFQQYKILLHGTSPTTSPAWLLLPNGASYTPFDFFISLGIAAVVISGCQLVAQRYARVLRPLADLGGRVLSAYVFHFVALAMWWEREEDRFSVWYFSVFAVVALVLATLWRQWIGRGPCEWLLHTLSRWPHVVLSGAMKRKAPTNSAPH